jgi:hypothetical protein
VAAVLIRPGQMPIAPAGWTSAGSLATTGWTLDYPQDWHLVQLPPCSNAPERTGVIVTNVDFEFLNPDGQPPRCEDRLVFAGFPPQRGGTGAPTVGGTLAIFVSRQDTPFPISPDLLEPTGGIMGGPIASYLGITVNGEEVLFLRMSVGTETSSATVEEADEVVRSLDVLGASRWTSFKDEQNGFEITYPDDWNRAEESLTPELAEPREIPSIGTYQLRSGGKACIDAYLPGNALEDLGTGDAFITIQESPEASGFPPRPGVFGPDSARLTVDGLPACDVYGAVQLRGWWFAFSDQGRAFYAFVALGQGLSHDGQVLRMVWHILDSFRVEPLAT